MGKQVIKEGDHITDIHGKSWRVYKMTFGTWAVSCDETGKVGFLEQFLIDNKKDYRFIYE